jgi:hypothetical protein
MDREGIQIPKEVASAQGVPGELNADIVGDYVFPDPQKRAIAGKLYLFGAAVLLGSGFYLGRGLWAVAAALLVVALYHFLTAWNLQTNDLQALAVAAAAIDFPVGHASAAIRFQGPRARPVWNVIMYDAEEPPVKRALVVLDAVHTTLIGEPYVEPVPN